jgi:hypothetical protein
MPFDRRDDLFALIVEKKNMLAESIDQLSASGNEVSSFGGGAVPKEEHDGSLG